MKMLQFIGTFLLGIILFLGLNIAIDSGSSCSNFSQHQGECYQDIK